MTENYRRWNELDTPNKVTDMLSKVNDLSKEDQAKLDKLFGALMKIKDIIDQDELKNCIEAEIIIH